MIEILFSNLKTMPEILPQYLALKCSILLAYLNEFTCIQSIGLTYIL